MKGGIILTMLEINKDDFEKIKTEAEKLYKDSKEVYCPYFKEKIFFNAKGLEHLKFKRRDKARSEKDQYMIFKLLNLAPEILKLSHTLQGVWETKKLEKVRIYSRNDIILKPVIYFEFIAVVKRNRIKVIIKEVDNGEKFFWSIIPFWGMNEETKTRILHEGDLEQD